MKEILEIAGVAIFVVFFFGFSIFIHEVGHFLVAKWRDLHIIAFSLGFKKIWSRKHNGVEYRIGCIPFGGYVDIPQIDSTGVPKTEDGEELPKAPPTDRILVALAGPLFNILFGFALGMIIWVWGVPQDTPRMNSIVVSSIIEDSPEFKAGLRTNDVITKVNGEGFYTTWIEFVRKILFSVGTVTLDVKRDGQPLKITYEPKENPDVMPQEKLAYPFFIPKIPVVIYPTKDSPAETAGLKPGDEVLKVNGKEISDHTAFTQLITKCEGKPLSFTVKRGGEIVEVGNILPRWIPDNPGVFQIGIIFSPEAPVKVTGVLADSPAQKAGLRPNDKIFKINGMPISDPAQFQNAIIKSGGAPLSMTILRGSDILDMVVKPMFVKFYDIGVELVFINYPSPWEQFVNVIDMSYKTLRGLFSPKSSIKAKHLSGPIGIVRGIGISVYKGSIMQGLFLVVMITFSLGILNLFPIPVLDGGHILMAVIEIVIRRPLPARLVQPVTIAFVVLLISFMVFVSYYDAARVYNDFFGEKISVAEAHRLNQMKKANAQKEAQALKHDNNPAENKSQD